MTILLSRIIRWKGGNHVAYQSVEEMKNVDPRTVDRSQLVDRESVRLDPDAG